MRSKWTFCFTWKEITRTRTTPTTTRRKEARGNAAGFTRSRTRKYKNENNALNEPLQRRKREKAEAEDKREAGGSSLLSYLGFNEKQTDDSVFQERLKPRYQAAGSRDSCGLFSLGRGWQELYAARAGCGGSSRGGGAFEDEEDEEDENTRDKNNTNTTKKKKTTKSSYFFSTKTSTKKARERC